MRKLAWADPRYATAPGALNFTLREPTKLFRAATFNNPLVGAGALGLLTGTLGYAFGDKIDRLLSPRFGGGGADYDPEYTNKRKRFWGLGTGLLTALGFLSTQYRPNAEWYGFKEYAPMDKLSKTAGMFDFDSAYNSGITIEDGANLILHDPRLNQEQKATSMALLRSFNAPPQQVINGNDLVGQAIGTGMSAATGAAVGFLTAKVLGLPNPQSTAILGAVGNTLGTAPALALSTIFGH